MLADPDGQKLWRRTCANPGARFIMLGTPNGGSHAIVTTMIGRDALVKKLALLDIKHSYADLLNYISRFFGVLQLLPYKGTVDVYEMAGWESLRTQDLAGQRGIGASPVAFSESAGFAWLLPDPEQLAEARRIRDLIRTSPIDPDRMIYVAGRADATAVDITIDADAPAGQRVAVIATADGDGRVPWATGIPPELSARTYYMDAVHGDLADVADAFPALLDLLTLGTTTKLSTTPPPRRGAAADTFILPTEVPTMFPDEQDILCSALGSSRRDVAAKPAENKVRVRVVHGNLSGATNPVLMGHYEGDSIVSAEAYMDRQLNGRLREAQRILLYPGPLNTVKLILNDRELCEQGAHPGAIVIGLGRVGDLTSGALASTFANAVTAYAIARVEEQRAIHKLGAAVAQDEARLKIALTSLVIGSREAGLGVADALEAILRGVLQANLHLRQLNQRRQGVAGSGENTRNIWVSAVIDSIDFIELWEDRAIRAAKALLRLGMSPEVRSNFDVEELLVEGRDGQGVDYGGGPRWWQTVRISTQEDEALKFETFADGVRSESFLHRDQRKLVETYLNYTAGTTLTSTDVSSTMFELLFPREFKRLNSKLGNLALVLDEGSAAYPWEMLQDRYEDESIPLSLQTVMLRQLVLSEFRTAVVHTTDFSALVIGDPTSNHESPDFPALPGAAAEARAVAKRLRDGGCRQVIELVGADATPAATVNALYARPYRILHLVGHGAFEYPIYDNSDQGQSDADERLKTVTGMVLGRDIFLTAAEIELMRTVPELVFINCCHPGQIKGEAELKPTPYHKLAAGVAAQFIRVGVRAVIAAGWVVDNSAASTFATKFYDCMLGGMSFGDAVFTARREVYLSGGGSNTWGAYQCYGDPDFSFGIPWHSVPSTDYRIVAGSELRGLANVISLRARTADSATTKRLIDELQSLVSSSPTEWLDSSATCGALASAYGELGMFDEALTYYEKIRSMHPADAKIESLEELVNLSGRWAVELFGDMLGPQAAAAPPEVRAKANELLATAEEILNGLLVIGKTSERLSLKGSIYKRKAMVATDSKERHEILRQMAHHYDAAYELGVRAERDDAYYSLANRLAAEIVLSWSDSARRRLSKAQKQRLDEIDRGLETVKSIAERTRFGSDFWADTMRGNVLLGKCMARQEISGADLEQLRAIYSNAAVRGGSIRWLRSVTDHIRFFQTMADAMADPGQKEALVESLKSLRESVTGVATKASV
jgi:pentatricopeptide repeat protein